MGSPCINISSNPMPTISQAAPLATQSPSTHAIPHKPLLYLPEYSSDASAWIYSALHPLESDTPLDGLLDNYSHLAAYPRPLAGLGIFCLDCVPFYAPDGVSAGEYPLVDVQAVPSDTCFDNKNSLHLGLPHYDLVGSQLECKEPVTSGMFADDSALSHWSSGLSLPVEEAIHRTGFSFDDHLATIPQLTSPSLHGLFQVPSIITPPMAPFVPDINMFELAWSSQAPSSTINPADTVVSSVPDGFTGGDLDSPLPPSSVRSSPAPFQSPISNTLSAEVLDEILSIMSASGTIDQAACSPDEVSVKAEPIIPSFTASQSTDAPAVLHVMPQYPAQILSFNSPCLIPSQPSSPPKPHIGIINSVNIIRNPRRQPKMPENDFVPHMGTPVLDAHHGVHLSELRAKAERYRQRNPGQDIDKRWLNSFAGKLSERGELLEDFRCYIVGCFQTNKRRDHILIHVGSHVDQRPFVCSHCPMRFLRKNECKRHEASHTGDKPYVCHVCPMKEKAFVRLDLLRRHLKRAHAIDPSADKENILRSTKRAKLCS